NQQENSSNELQVDDVIVWHGYAHEKELINNSKVSIKMKNEYCIDGTPLSETSVPGIFAAGDVLTHEGTLHLIAGTFQDAANAANRAKQDITPDATSYGMVSSHNYL